MRCKYCGYEEINNNGICPVCNEKNQKECFETTLSEEFKLFVGDGYDYYEHTWRKSLDNGNWSSSKFNRAAFLFGPLWMLYRKMYLNALLTVILLLILAFILPPKFPAIIINLLIASYANKLYYNYSKKKINKITLDDDIRSVEEKQDRIVKTGGTSKAMFCVGIITTILIISLYWYNFSLTVPKLDYLH